MESNEHWKYGVPGWIATSHAYAEVADKWEHGRLQWPFQGGASKEMKTSWMYPSLADQTAGLECRLVVV